METILKIRNLNKHYKDLHIIKDASLTINKGGIYGFIGQNGSGKTTIIRLITGLAFGDEAGKIELFGETSQAGLEKARARMDGVIENPYFYPNFTAYENLKLKCNFLGIKNEQKIEDLLKLVNLHTTGKKKVKNFSLGMKQRLAIALSLINDPEFLILDEPTNGLDPAGIKEIRELMKTLAKDHGITILVSSHLLAELKLLVDNYIVIRDGHIIDEFEAKELDSRFTKQLEIKCKPITKAAKLLKDLGLKEVKSKDGLITSQVPKDVASVNKALIESGIMVTSFTTKNKDAEGYFMNLMGGSNDA